MRRSCVVWRRESRDGAQNRRLLALAVIYDGHRRSDPLQLPALPHDTKQADRYHRRYPGLVTHNQAMAPACIILYRAIG